MDKTPAFVVSGDSILSRIEVRYQGRVAESDVQAAYEAVAALLPLMRRGFTLLADFSGLESMELDCAPHITKIMDACNTAGIGTVVRVVPDRRKDIGLNILSIIHYGRGVHVLTFENSEEAKRAL